MVRHAEATASSALIHRSPGPNLPRIFATHAPLCWTCHLAMSFRREHPELPIERPRLEPKPTTLQPTTAVY